MTYSPIHHQTIRFLETKTPYSTQWNEYFKTFALDECLLQTLAQPTNAVFLHFWEMHDTVILGMTDTRTPHLPLGIQFLKKQDFIPLVRHAGGLAVVSNEGILNMSLLFNAQKTSSIQQVYEWMKLLIQTAFPEATGSQTIEAFEIVNSYCPGAYDLSIHGKKFAGMAQRRLKQATCVSIYLSVHGNQNQRGTLIRDFYEKSIQGETTKWHFPTVHPDSMANLSDLLQLPLTTTQVKERILNGLLRLNCQLVEESTDFTTSTMFQKALERLQKRNEIILNC